MTFVSIVVPAFNAAETIGKTIESLLVQTYSRFDITIVDDGSTDNTLEVVANYDFDGRIRVIRQPNRGLAGARNTGIASALGDLIAFCDADDVWSPNKLDAHVRHLEERPAVGISYSGSSMFTDSGVRMHRAQRPRLRNIRPEHILKRNPIGNGSAAVVRRQVFDEIAYRPTHETVRDWYFDETFRQSEDIECWLRIALTTDWQFEGVRGLLSHYRINSNGLSAATERQLASWDRMIEKLRPLDPEFFAKHENLARAYQFRYLCRRAINSFDIQTARSWADAWLETSKLTFLEEPRKSIETYLAVLALQFIGNSTLRGLSAVWSGR